MQRLLKRQDFLFVRDGPQGTCRDALPAGPLAPRRFCRAPAGFTVTKKAGCAVERNRIRRRLREAVRLSGALLARDGYDYVIMGRRSALDASFATIVNELKTAFGRVHAERPGARRADRSADEAAR